PRIAGRVEPADLSGDIRLEGAVAEDQRAECEQEQLLDRHQEMADRHEDRAEYYGPALSQDAIGDETAENRRQIDERRVEPVDLRRQGLQIERTEYRFECALEARQADHGPGLLGQEQMFRHVENEQCAHPVVREALPHLGGEQEGEAPRMAEKLPTRRRPVVARSVAQRERVQPRRPPPPYSVPANVAYRACQMTAWARPLRTGPQSKHVGGKRTQAGRRFE